MSLKALDANGEDDDELKKVFAEAEENCRVRLAHLAAMFFLTLGAEVVQCLQVAMNRFPRLRILLWAGPHRVTA